MPYQPQDLAAAIAQAKNANPSLELTIQDWYFNCTDQPVTAPVKDRVTGQPITLPPGHLCGTVNGICNSSRTGAFAGLGWVIAAGIPDRRPAHDLTSPSLLNRYHYFG